MDLEDRDHFKTIAGVSAALPAGLRKPQNGASSHSVLDPAYCLRKTQELFNCYRKDEAHDPEVYCAAVAATLADFSRSVVDYVTDPRTGIASESRFLPNIAEIRAACVRETQRQEMLAKPAIKINRAYLPPPERQPGTDYFSMFESYGRPVGRFENTPMKQNDLPPIDHAAEALRIQAANRVYFERECREQGVNPAGGVSPSLLKTLSENQGGVNE